MDCPHCRVPLAIAERQGIEVDYCPQCRGVWLDRGELDKIIDRSLRQWDTPATAQPLPPAPPAPPAGAWGQPQGGYGQDRHYGHKPHKHHKRKSFLEDLFDF